MRGIFKTILVKLLRPAVEGIVVETLSSIEDVADFHLEWRGLSKRQKREALARLAAGDIAELAELVAARRSEAG